ncbi:nucleoside diphosphate kinase regulator [Chitinolyticbacter meiyuanensis]|uniref:nucleoside diphosphate kinase regulator n=1 Tax=Chitinolyticbacter meiyuanensis TaxID=682798 RepID=UPI0011E5CFA5|nr:nucleoside diphosphate kinase regulator [Chitinolyticbacter meiyuanensis]
MQPTIILSEHHLERLETLIARQQPRTAAIEALEEELARAEIVPETALPADVIVPGRSARFVETGSGREYSYTLVYPHEADLAQGRISVLLPAGSALLGLRVGQSIDWPLTDGKALHLTVLAVEEA